MRSVRESLQRRAQDRGRPIELAVRVPERLAWCENGGFEVARWVHEDLVDMLIVGQALTDLPTLGEFHELTEKRHVPVYPCITPFGNGYRVSPDEVIRGSAANLWADGADGLYVGNWCFHGSWRRHLLGQISSPDSLVRLPQRYILSHRVAVPRGQTGADYIRYNVQGKDAPLPAQLKENVPQRFVLGGGAAPDSTLVRPEKVELWIGVDFLGDQDVLSVTMNGSVLSVPINEGRVVLSVLGERIEVPAGDGILGFPVHTSLDEEFQGIRIDIPPEILKRHRNELEVVVTERSLGLKHDLRVNRLELDLLF
jgi:hypothetical protein